MRRRQSGREAAGDLLRRWTDAGRPGRVVLTGVTGGCCRRPQLAKLQGPLGASARPAGGGMTAGI